MRILVVTIIALLIFSTGFTRNVTMTFDGEIDYTSQHGNDQGEGVVVIQGEGSGTVSQSAEGSEGKFKHDVEVEFAGVEVTVGLNAPQGLSVTRIKPEPGEGGRIEQSSRVTNDEFATLTHRHESLLTQGQYNRKVDMKNEDGYVKEVLSLFGAGWISELLTFGVEEQEE